MRSDNFLFFFFFDNHLYFIVSVALLLSITLVAISFLTLLTMPSSLLSLVYIWLQNTHYAFNFIYVFHQLWGLRTSIGKAILSDRLKVLMAWEWELFPYRMIPFNENNLDALLSSILLLAFSIMIRNLLSQRKHVCLWCKWICSVRHFWIQCLCLMMESLYRKEIVLQQGLSNVFVSVFILLRLWVRFLHCAVVV